MNRKAAKKGQWIPWAIVGFFVFLALADGVFVYLALESFPGVSDENAYEKGRRYNAVLEKAAANEALGWQGFVRKAGEEQGAVEVVLKDRDGQPLANLEVSALAVWPPQRGFDTKVSFEQRALGVYRAQPDLPLSGQWEFRVRARAPDGRVFIFNGRVVL